MNQTRDLGKDAAELPPPLLRQVPLDADAARALGLVFDPAGAQDGLNLFALVDLADIADARPLAVAVTGAEPRGTTRLHAFAIRPGPDAGVTAGRLIGALADRLRACGVQTLLSHYPGDEIRLQQLLLAGFGPGRANENLELEL